MFTFTFHTDLGHGWLEVPTAIVEALGITVSPWSYTKGGSMFLEEDRDASLFVDAAKAAGLKYKTEGKHFEGTHPLKTYARVIDPKYKRDF